MKISGLVKRMNNPLARFPAVAKIGTVSEEGRSGGVGYLYHPPCGVLGNAKAH